MKKEKLELIARFLDNRKVMVNSSDGGISGIFMLHGDRVNNSLDLEKFCRSTEVYSLDREHRVIKGYICTDHDSLCGERIGVENPYLYSWSVYLFFRENGELEQFNNGGMIERNVMIQSPLGANHYIDIREIDKCILNCTLFDLV